MSSLTQSLEVCFWHTGNGEKQWNFCMLLFLCLPIFGEEILNIRSLQRLICMLQSLHKLSKSYPQDKVPSRKKATQTASPWAWWKNRTDSLLISPKGCHPLTYPIHHCGWNFKIDITPFGKTKQTPNSKSNLVSAAGHIRLCRELEHFSGDVFACSQLVPPLNPVIFVEEVIKNWCSWLIQEQQLWCHTNEYVSILPPFNGLQHGDRIWPSQAPA